jgi:hypothetical protein
MRDACAVEVIRGFVKQQNIGVPDERGCEKKARLLAARKLIQFFFRRNREMNRIENFFDPRRDVVHCFFKLPLEKLIDGEIHLESRDNLARERDRRTVCYRDRTGFGPYISLYEMEDGAFAGAILAHERYFRAAADRKVRSVENELLAVLECDVVEANDDLVLRHLTVMGN